MQDTNLARIILKGQAADKAMEAYDHTPMWVLWLISPWLMLIAMGGALRELYLLGCRAEQQYAESMGRTDS